MKVHISGLLTNDHKACQFLGLFFMQRLSNLLNQQSTEDTKQFQVSGGSLSSFKKRCSIHSFHVQGESLSADAACISSYIDRLWIQLEGRALCAEQVYSADDWQIQRPLLPICVSPLKLSVIYRHQSNMWMTQEIFTEWFHNYFVPSVKDHLAKLSLPLKALLLVGNYSAHPKKFDLQNAGIVTISCQILYKLKILEREGRPIPF